MAIESLADNERDSNNRRSGASTGILDDLLATKMEVIDISSIEQLGILLAKASAIQAHIASYVAEGERHAAALFADGVTSARPIYQQNHRYLYAAFPRAGNKSARRVYIGRNNPRVDVILALMHRGKCYRASCDQLRQISLRCVAAAELMAKTLRILNGVRTCCVAPITVEQLGTVTS